MPRELFAVLSRHLPTIAATGLVFAVGLGMAGAFHQLGAIV